MITKTRKATISGGVAPYEYAWITDNPCVTFSNQTGVTSKTEVETLVSFVDETCIGTANLSFSVTDDKGCSSVTTFTITNPCTDFVLTDIVQQSNSSFYVAASSTGCTGIESFEWSFDSKAFTKVSQADTSFTSTLSLSLNTGQTSFPASTPITVKAIDCNGCEKTKTFVYSLCITSAPNIQVNLTKNTLTETYYTSPTTPLPELLGCVGRTTSFASAVFELPAGFSIVRSTTNPLEVDRNIVFRADSTVAPGIYTFKYSMKDQYGLSSNKGTVIATVVAPNEGKTIAVADRTISIDCALVAGNTLSIDIEDDVKVVEGATIDWTSWQTVEPPTPIAATPTLTTDVDGRHVIEYVLPSPIVDDVFGWTVCDTNGNCANAVVYTVTRCPSVPTAVNDSGTVACGSSVVINLTANDLGNGSPIDVASIELTASPTKGVVSLPGDGTAVYTANAAVSGSDTFKYKIRNAHGKISTNEATVTITINCAGTNASVTLCN